MLKGESLPEMQIVQIVLIFPVKLGGYERMDMQTANQSVNKKAYLEILLGIVLLGTGPLFVKFVRANGTQVAFYRLLFAAGMLAAPALISRSKRKPQTKEKSAPAWLIAGGIAFAVNIALWCSALNFTTAAIVTLLDNTAPIWVGLFSFLVLRNRQSTAYWIGLCLAVAGGTLLVSGSLHAAAAGAATGILLSIASGMSYAAYILLTQRARASYSSVTYSWMVAVIGAAALFIFGLVSGAFREALSLQGYVLIFLMSLSSQVLGWYLVNSALGKLPATAASVTLVGQPVVTTVLGILILGELLSVSQFIGIGVCLLGILLVQRRVKAG